jgi:hypothetical protein
MLDEFIRKNAKEVFPELFDRTDYFQPNEKYRETVNPDALSDDWLQNNTTYIYKVGVYLVYDSNKMDWLYAFYGYQRYEKGGMAFLGYLQFPQGENDDMSRTFTTIFKHIDTTIGR